MITDYQRAEAVVVYNGLIDDECEQDCLVKLTYRNLTEEQQRYASAMLLANHLRGVNRFFQRNNLPPSDTGMGDAFADVDKTPPSTAALSQARTAFRLINTCEK